MNKIRERTRLLKAYRRTGDQDYLRAAECLQIPLLDHLEQLRLWRRRGRGRGIAGITARPRLYRMHRLVSTGLTMYAAACREVADHGRGDHASNEAAIDYLRNQYADHRERIAAVVTMTDAMRAHWRALDKQYASIAELYRTARAPLPTPIFPPAWMHSIAQAIRHPMSWRNTRPKIDENKSNA